MSTGAPAITAEVAQRVLDVVDQGLSAGLGKPTPGLMCVEAAVCYALGLPHDDDPRCVSSALRNLKIRLNDAKWSSNAARAKGLRRLAVAQLGSKDALDDRRFAKRVAEMTIRTVVPIALRAAGNRICIPKHAEALKAAAVRCEQEGTRIAARAAYAAAAAADARDRVLSEFAERVVQILVAMKAPGVAFLPLTEVA